jgi:16S rRNA (adenine1518-N6/adenine1519-N6)-dimethyltransferase
VSLIKADILSGKNRLNPQVLELLTAAQHSCGCKHLRLVANLPYAVATPVVSNVLLSEFSFERLVVMVQWEIAERLLALPGTKDYGALAVLVQSLADVEAVRRRLPPAVFWPRPQVASAIVLIRPNAAKRARVGEAARLRVFLRDLYSHRRKNLRGALAALPGRSRAKQAIDAQLAELGLNGNARAEDLDVEQHLRLYAVFG